jgi:hypothetical protein
MLSFSSTTLKKLDLASCLRSKIFMRSAATASVARAAITIVTASLQFIFQCPTSL